MEAGAEIDVAIVGAGISGIGAAIRLQQKCPGLSYRILEARPDSGGTWDLFRYPGVRSDSDMFTLAYPFRPWRGANAIADGPEILTYLRENADHYGVDRHIRYGYRVTGASWSSATQRWTVQTTENGSEFLLSCRFLYVCTGYYDAQHAYEVPWPGRETFGGTVIHPQFWPDDAPIDGRRVVVIGSGATAITLVPAIAERAAEVIMVQRSPSYVAGVPRRDRTADRLRSLLPAAAAHHLVRLRNVIFSTALYQLSRRRPAAARRLLLGRLARVLPPSMISDHFSPRYNVWDQRLCATPDDDFFLALRSGRAQVVTGEIERWESAGIRLRSGQLIEADVIITATGLELLPLGGMSLDVDGRPVDLPHTFAYRGCLLAGVPNFAAALGYANNSWTLRVDLVSRYVARLLDHLDRHDLGVAVPVAPTGMPERRWLPLTSGYVQRGIDRFPKVGDRDPWLMRQNYLLDAIAFATARITEDMEFQPVVSRGARMRTAARS